MSPGKRNVHTEEGLLRPKGYALRKAVASARSSSFLAPADAHRFGGTSVELPIPASLGAAKPVRTRNLQRVPAVRGIPTGRELRRSPSRALSGGCPPPSGRLPIFLEGGSPYSSFRSGSRRADP